MRKSVSAFVLGLIGGIIGIIGGIYLAICASFLDEVTSALGESTNLSLFAWLFGVGGSVIIIVGGAMALSNAFKGGIVLIIGAIFELVAILTIGSSAVYIIALVTGAIAGLIGLLTPAEKV